MTTFRKIVIVVTTLCGYAFSQKDQCSAQCQQSSLEFAYQYGYPLYALGLNYARYKDALANTMFVMETLATPAITAVVRPSVDTLMARCFTDLSQDDLVYYVPEVDEGRYWVHSFYDAYGDNFANIASISGHKAGHYLLQARDGDFGLQLEEGNASFGGTVNFPTPYGTILVRIAVDNTGTDLEYVKSIEEMITVQPANMTRPKIAPPLDIGSITQVVHNTSLSNAEVVMELTAVLAPYNLPKVLSDRPWINTTLTRAGITDGTFVRSKDTNLTLAATSANASAANFFVLSGSSQDLGNNWTQPSPQLIGTYGSFYNARHGIAAQGYLALTSDIAIYPQYRSRPGPITAPEGPTQAFLVTFQGKPKLKPSGFWSLTIYNKELYLVPNDLDRYVLNDRSNITYADGSPVYGDADRDGEFQILLQSADTPPPANWTSNWLPTPAGGGEWANNLRFYGAEDAMINGLYIYPVITLIDAIIE